MRVRIRSRNGGRRGLSKDQIALIVDFVKWSAARLMPTIHKNVEIDLILDSKLFTKTKTYGMAIWEDRHVRGRQFSIEVDVTFSFVSIVHTVAHEMVHVKQ